MLGEYQYMASLSYIEKQGKRKEKKTDKFYAIMRKTGKALDEVTRNDLTKSEYKFIVEYITEIMNNPMSFYPNLQ